MHKNTFVNTRVVTAWFGLSGVASICCGSLITAFTYTGRNDQVYRIWNHFVSELGEVGISQYAWLFNLMLILGGICITLFMLGTAREFRNWFSFVFGIAGMATGVSATLVGVFPMNNIGSHIKVAMMFFNMGLLTMLLISLYIAFTKQVLFPRWFIIPGAMGTLCFALFLNFPSPSSSTEPALGIPARLLADRPEIWPLAMMEWAVVIIVLAWVTMVSLHLLLSPK